MFLLQGDGVGWLHPPNQLLDFLDFVFLDFVFIFAKTEGEKVSCEMWLQSSDIGVRNDIGNFLFVATLAKWSLK